MDSSPLKKRNGLSHIHKAYAQTDILLNRLLERQKIGVFLVRFSQSKPGAFAIAFVTPAGTIPCIPLECSAHRHSGKEKAVKHSLISCSPQYVSRFSK